MTAVRSPLVRRTFTSEDKSGPDLVEWAERSPRIFEPDGSVAFTSRRAFEAPVDWSSLAVAVVARRYFARDPDGPVERSVRTLLDRVTGAIASWALELGQVVGDVEREALFNELAALVLTQRATLATPAAGRDDR
jgi:hypothetical protein